MEVDADKLVVLVHARPPIFDFTLKEHHNRDVTNKLWDEIGAELKATGNFN